MKLETLLPIMHRTMDKLGFGTDERSIPHKWDNAECAVVIVFWPDNTIEISGISDFIVQDTIGPLLDQMDIGEADEE